MTHEEFVNLRRAGGAAVGMASSTAIRLVGRLPGRYQAAHHFWSWVWMLSIPAFIVTAIFVKWWLGLLLLFIATPMISSAVKRSATEFVLEHATENKEFFEFLVANELLVFQGPRQIALERVGSDAASVAEEAPAGTRREASA